MVWRREAQHRVGGAGALGVAFAHRDHEVVAHAFVHDDFPGQGADLERGVAVRRRSLTSSLLRGMLIIAMGVNEGILADVEAMSGAATRRDALNIAFEDYVRRIAKVLAAMGTLDLDVDVQELRERDRHRGT